MQSFIAVHAPRFCLNACNRILGSIMSCTTLTVLSEDPSSVINTSKSPKDGANTLSIAVRIYFS